MVIALAVSLDEDVERIIAAVRRRVAPRERPVLTVLVGLPATGKTRVAAELQARTSAVVLESDELRRLLFRQRTYSPLESRRLFAAIHEATERLLAEGVSVILDATNVAEAERRPLYKMTERHGARLVLVRVSAPPALVRRRLARRSAGDQADVHVYERMRARLEPVGRPHHVVNTSQSTRAAVAAIAKEMMKP